jgi:hypothetical protein
MSAATALLPNANPRDDDAAVLAAIDALPGLDQEAQPVFRAGICNGQGFIYRAVVLYSMHDVLHLSTALSRAGFSFEGAKGSGPRVFDGLFTKE